MGGDGAEIGLGGICRGARAGSRGGPGGSLAWFRIGQFWVTRAHEEGRSVRAGCRRPICPVREAVSLPRSSPPGLKRSQAEQGEPVQMILAGHQLSWALALALGVPAAQETAVVQKEPQQVQV